MDDFAFCPEIFENVNDIFYFCEFEWLGHLNYTCCN